MRDSIREVLLRKKIEKKFHTTAFLLLRAKSAYGSKISHNIWLPLPTAVPYCKR